MLVCCDQYNTNKECTFFADLAIATMSFTALDSTYKMATGYEIPVVGYGVYQTYVGSAFARNCPSRCASVYPADFDADHPL